MNETSKIWFSIIALAENHVRNFYERRILNKNFFYLQDMVWSLQFWVRNFHSLCYFFAISMCLVPKNLHMRSRITGRKLLGLINVTMQKVESLGKAFLSHIRRGAPVKLFGKNVCIGGDLNSMTDTQYCSNLIFIPF